MAEPLQTSNCFQTTVTYNTIWTFFYQLTISAPSDNSLSPNAFMQWLKSSLFRQWSTLSGITVAFVKFLTYLLSHTCKQLCKQRHVIGNFSATIFEHHSVSEPLNIPDLMHFLLSSQTFLTYSLSCYPFFLFYRSRIIFALFYHMFHTILRHWIA